MKQTTILAKEEGVTCDYLAYNPEDREGTPPEELDYFVRSVMTAQQIAHGYGADLILFPGTRFMMEHEEYYSQAAPFADIWLIQTQDYQIYREDHEWKWADLNYYHDNIKRLTELLRQGNPTIKIWAQISTTPGKLGQENPLSAARVTTYAQSISDLTRVIRFYTKDDPDKAEKLNQIVNLLRP